MAFKSLLLDVHGVVLRDRELLDHVNTNCVAYVQKKVPLSKNPPETARLLCAAYGHATKGLQKVYGVDTSDFVDEVYDKHLMSHLQAVVCGTEFQSDAAIIHGLSHMHDWKVSLVTNAPLRWTQCIKNAIGDVYTVSKDSAVYPEHHVHLYVDDSPEHVEQKLLLPNWNPILFTDTKTTTSPYIQVRSFEELLMYINSFDMWTTHDHWHTFEF
jgi:hypothetical protein